MTMSRRTILKRLAFGGAAAPVLTRSLPSLAAAATDVSTAPATLLLVPAGTRGNAFEQGARAAIGDARLVVQEARIDLAFLREIEAVVRRGMQTRVIGLLDDAVATPLLDVARGAGVPLFWLGHHNVGREGARHRCQPTAGTEACARFLAVGGEQTDWASKLGYLLATPGAREPARLPSPPGAVSLPGSFVSFLMHA